jgi:hypothetical protein
MASELWYLNARLKLPAASRRESSKCKEVIPFYCSSLANPARLRQNTGNALAGAFSKVEYPTMDDVVRSSEKKYSRAVYLLRINDSREKWERRYP